MKTHDKIGSEIFFTVYRYILLPLALYFFISFQMQESFQFKPVESNWRQQQMMNLNISAHIIDQLAHGEWTPVPLTPPVACRAIIPDDNCLFRSLSYSITGTESHHQCIRSAICEFMKGNPQEISAILPPIAGKNVNTYLELSHMETLATWGTEVELLAAAVLLQTNIYIYTQTGGHWKWNRYSPNYNVNHGIYMYHKNGNHFDVVVAT